MSAVAAQSDDSRPLRSDILDGLSVWGGEAFIGMLPLLTHWFAGLYFPATAGTDESLQGEICILAVVTSGLSMLALLPFGPKGRKVRFTRLTFWIFILTLASLIAGTLLYGFIFSHSAKPASLVTFGTLATALFGSFGLTIEGELLRHTEKLS